MARSIDPVVHAVRGFVPARTDEERFLMRHIEDLARTAQSRGIARYSGFLSDREQELARAALGRAGLEEGFRFDGGWPEAERRILCLEPEYSYPENPICCVQLQCRAQAGAVLPAHKDYLGSLMGLEIRREALGDIILPPDAPGTAYVFALEPAAGRPHRAGHPTAGTGRGAGVPDGRAPEMHRNGVVAAAGRRAGRHAALQPWAGQ